jgi:hypothetical protein
MVTTMRNPGFYHRATDIIAVEQRFDRTSSESLPIQVVSIETPAPPSTTKPILAISPLKNNSVNENTNAATFKDNVLSLPGSENPLAEDELRRRFHKLEEARVEVALLKEGVGESQTTPQIEANQTTGLINTRAMFFFNGSRFDRLV